MAVWHSACIQSLNFNHCVKHTQPTRKCNVPNTVPLWLWNKVKVIKVFRCLFSTLLSFVGNLKCLTWVKHSSHKSSAIHSCQCVQYFHVSRQWCGCPCLGFLTCVLMLMHSIAARGCMDTASEPAPKVDTGRNFFRCCGDLNPRQYCALAFQSDWDLLPPPPPQCFGVVFCLFNACVAPPVLNLTLQQAPGNQKDQSHGEFCRTVRGHIWCVVNLYIPSFALSHVNMLRSYRQCGNHPQLRSCGKDWTGSLNDNNSGVFRASFLSLVSSRRVHFINGLKQPTSPLHPPTHPDVWMTDFPWHRYEDYICTAKSAVSVRPSFCTVLCLGGDWLWAGIWF